MTTYCAAAWTVHIESPGDTFVAEFNSEAEARAYASEQTDWWTSVDDFQHTRVEAPTACDCPQCALARGAGVAS